MTTLQVFDRPMCCSTGVCGPQVDPVLPRFAADLDWLKAQGVTVERYNLAQEPAAFTQYDDVTGALVTENVACLPLFRVNGEIVFKGNYPSRSMLASWCGVSATTTLAVTEPSCCGPSGCC
jgi:arsenite methyltransferase